jgi:hypothetical protein
METRINDIVMIHQGREIPCFARVENLEEDVKPGWWQITLLPFRLPLQYTTWILRREYIDGQNFTMDGETMRLERLPRPNAFCITLDIEENVSAARQKEKAPLPGGREMGKVIALHPRKPKD